MRQGTRTSKSQVTETKPLANKIKENQTLSLRKHITLYAFITSLFSFTQNISNTEIKRSMY